jgi:hypothetical protein
MSVWQLMQSETFPPALYTRRQIQIHERTPRATLRETQLGDVADDRL